MTATVSALAMVLSTFYGWPLPHLLRHSEPRATGWHLTVHRDSFDGTVSCRIWRHSATYAPGVVVLRLDPSTDTSQAEYRIDDGAPRAAIHTLEALGSPKAPDLHTAVFNPSGGEVVVPEAEILGAREVEVRTQPKYPVAFFRVDGLAKAIADARGAGCESRSIEGAR